MRNRTATNLSIASIAGAMPRRPARPPTGGGLMKLFRPLFRCFRGCSHSQTRLIFTINRRTYLVCRRCGLEFDYAGTDPVVQSSPPFKVKVVDGFAGEFTAEPLAAWVPGLLPQSRLGELLCSDVSGTQLSCC